MPGSLPSDRGPSFLLAPSSDQYLHADYFVGHVLFHRHCIAPVQLLSLFLAAESRTAP